MGPTPPQSSDRHGPTPPRRTVVIAVVATVVVALLAVATVVILNRQSSDGQVAAPPVAVAPQPPLYVSPDGRDSNDGGTPATALATIQAALEKATPGTTINLAPGVYHEELTTVRDGAPGAPIVIKGPETGTDREGRYRAVLYGTGRLVNIDHSWITLDGFTVDGQEQLGGVPFPTDVRTIDAWKASVQDRVEDSRLVYIGSAEESRDLTGITISNMFLNGAGGECVRLRNNAHGNTIIDSVIQYCGMYGKGDGEERAEYHNGEGVYIGTSPESDGQPMSDNDTSSQNVVARNIIRTFGSECFNVKENAHDNVFEDNVCSSNTESARVRGQQRRAARLREHRAQQPDLGQRRLLHQDPDRRRGVRPGRQRRREQPALRRRGRDVQDQVRRESGPLLRQQHRRLRSAVQRRQRRHDAVGDHHPLLTRSAQLLLG